MSHKSMPFSTIGPLRSISKAALSGRAFVMAYAPAQDAGLSFGSRDDYRTAGIAEDVDRGTNHVQNAGR